MHFVLTREKKGVKKKKLKKKTIYKHIIIFIVNLMDVIMYLGYKSVAFQVCAILSRFLLFANTRWKTIFFIVHWHRTRMRVWKRQDEQGNLNSFLSTVVLFEQSRMHIHTLKIMNISHTHNAWRVKIMKSLKHYPLNKSPLPIHLNCIFIPWQCFCLTVNHDGPSHAINELRDNIYLTDDQFALNYQWLMTTLMARLQRIIYK